MFDRLKKGKLIRKVSFLSDQCENTRGSIGCCSVAKSCLTLQPHGLQHTRLPVLHHLLEFAYTHVHGVGDAIEPSLPLLSPSPTAFSVSQG